MMKVAEILKKKGPEVFTIGENKTLFDAARILVTNRIGVLLVLNDSAKISGIISERDILRSTFESPDDWKDFFVKDIMTRRVIVVEAEDDTEYVESVMTANRIRHLPVLKNGVLVGLISIGDIVKNILSGTRSENKYLLDYISGNVT